MERGRGPAVNYRFGEFTLRAELAQLQRGDVVLDLRPKVLDVLLYLVRNRGRVMSRRELLDELWGEVVVTDHVLDTAIHEVRSALGDSGTRQLYVKTVSRKGYRFVAAVEELPEAAAREPESPARSDVVRQHEARGFFVGRDAELARLHDALDDAFAGRGSVVLLAGEPGVGKTRTAEEFCARASHRDARVLAGWCYEGEGAPPYWPWVQVLRDAIRGAEAGSQEEDPEGLMGELATILPELDEESSGPRRRPEEARFRLFDSITRFLVRFAANSPVVMVLDDLHWADRASLRLLEFIAHEVRGSRLLVVGAFRDGPSDRSEALSRSLGTLSRLPAVTRLTLGGLGAEAVTLLLADQRDGPASIEDVMQWTDGNPFLIGELLATPPAVREQGRGATAGPAVSPALRDVVQRRLRGLSRECRELLELASVFGRDFSPIVISDAVGLGEREVAPLLEEAERVGIAHEHPRERGTFRFVHALTQEAIRAEQSAAGRAEKHHRIAQALERRYAQDPGPRLRMLAHHFAAALPASDPEKALAYALGAAENASVLHAYDDAARYYEQALQILELARSASPAKRCELLVALGEAESAAGAYRERGRLAFRQAAELARSLSEPHLFARAAFGMAGGADEIAGGDQEAMAWLEEANRALRDEASPLRASLLAHLAIATWAHESLESALSLSNEAVAIARKTGDQDALGLCLNLRLAFLSGPTHFAERLATAEEILDLAESTGSAELDVFGLRWRLTCFLEMGDVPAADADIRAYVHAAERDRVPDVRWYATTLLALRALMEGRFDEGERLAFEAFASFQNKPNAIRVLFYAAQFGLVRREQGRLSELEPFLKANVEVNTRHPAYVGYRVSLALFHAELGNAEEAKRELDQLAANDFAELPDSLMFLFCLAALAETCAHLDERRYAEILYPMLAPYGDLHVQTGVAAVSLGSASRYLGLLARVTRRWSDAARHFEDALRANANSGERPWLAYTQHDYARLLHERRLEDDPERALALAGEALSTARELRMEALESRSRALIAEIRDAVPRSDSRRA